MPNYYLDPWGVTKGAQDTTNLAETVDKAYGIDQLYSGTGGRNGLGLSKAEEKELKAKQQEQFINAATQEAINKVLQNDIYQQSSVQKRGDLIANYLNTTLPQFMDSNATYINNPELRTAVYSSITNALTKLHTDDQKKINDDGFFNYASEFFKGGLDNSNVASAATAAATENAIEFQNKETDEQAELMRQNYETQLAELQANMQDAAGDPAQVQRYREQIQKLHDNYQKYVESVNSTRENNQKNHERTQEENAKALLEAYERKQKNEQQRMQDSALYKEIVLRQGELAEEAKAKNETLWLGLEDNDHKTATIAKYLLENAPDIVGAVSTGVLTAPLGGSAQTMAMAAYNAATVFGQVGQQVLGDIMEADLASLEKLEDYTKVRDGLLKQGKTAKEADSQARVQLAIKTLQEQNGLSYVPAILSGALGPEALLLKTGLGTRLLNAGIIRATRKNVLTRATAGTALEAGVEGGEEVYENAVAINLANKALNGDRSLFEDWQQNFGVGALLGGIMGAPGGVRSTREAREQEQSQETVQRTGAAGGTTRTTLSGQDTSAPNDNISVTAETTSPAYDPKQEEERAAQIHEAQQTLARIGNQFVKDELTFESADQIPQDVAVQLAHALTVVQNSGKRGDELVDTWIRGVNSATNSKLTTDDVMKFVTDILAKEAQAAAPSSTTNGGANGTNNGTDQTTAAPAGKTADTEPSGNVAAQPADTTGNTGSGTTAQSTGTGRTTRTDTRETTAPVSPNQPTNEQTGQGTNSGRDSTVNDSTGTQPDTGTGSTAGTTEQRTGNDGRTENNGTAEQTGTDVGAQQPADESSAQSTDEGSAQEAPTTPEEALVEAVGGKDTTAEATAEAEGSDEVLVSMHELLSMGKEKYDALYKEIRSQIHELLKLDKNIPDEIADYYTVYYMRMAATISQVAHVSIDKALPIAKGITFEHGLASDEHGVTRARIDTRGKGRNAKVISVHNMEISIARNGLNDATLMHEFVHLFINQICGYASQIKQYAEAGDIRAAEFIEQFTAFARALGMPDSKDPFDIRSWSKAGTKGDIAEQASTAFESYFVRGERPEQLLAQLPEFDETTTRKAEKFFERMEYAYQKMIDEIYIVLKACEHLWTKLTKGGTIFPDPSGMRLSDFNEANAVYRDTRYAVDYAVPRLRYGWSILRGDTRFDPTKIVNFFDTMLGGYQNLTDNVVSHESAVNYAYLDTAANELTVQYIASGMSPNEAYAAASAKVQRAIELVQADKNGATKLRTAEEKQTVDDAMERNPDNEVLSDSEMAGSQTATDTVTSDGDLVDISLGINNPDANSANDVTNPISELDDDVEHNTPEVNGETSVTDDAEQIAETIKGIDQEITDGITDQYVDETKEPWFSDFFDESGIRNEDGTPKQFYRNGFVLTENPTGAELETSVYARAATTVSSPKEIMDMGLDPDVRKAAIAAFNKFSKSVKAGKPIELDINTREDLIDAGIYAFNVDGTIHIMDDYDMSDTYQAMSSTGNVLELRNSSISIGENYPNTQDALATKAAEIIKRNNEKFSEAAQKAQLEKDLTKADMERVATDAPMKAGWWQNLCTRTREYFSSDARFRLFAALNFSPKIGEVDSIPWYMAWRTTRPRIQGAFIELTERIMNPLNAWIKTVSKDLGMDFNVVKQELGQIRTDFHTIEAAQRQEEELRFAVTRAQMLVEGSEEAQALGGKQAAIDAAQAELDLYLAYQRGETDESGNPIECQVYGGRRVKDVTAELFGEDGNGGLVGKYGQSVVEQALGRFGKAFEDATMFAIERGAISMQDIEQFGDWMYYTPLTTKPDYENGDSSDVVAMYPKRIVMHRGGSVTPAVDGYTALQMLLKRTSNAVGSVELSRETKGAYDQLRTRAIAEARLPEDERTVTKHSVTLMSDGRIPTRITYYNGMALVKLSALMEHKENHSKLAKELDENKSMVIRVLEPVEDSDGNVIGTQNVAYAVLFDKEHEDVSKSFGEPFHYDKEANDKFKHMRKMTSGYASLFTTYRPFFPPINAIRDFIERTYFSARKTFRGADGEAIRGDMVSLRMQANMAYAPEVMKAVFTGKPEQIGGKVGEYLSEFKRSGIMTSASIRAMLQDMGNTNYAYVEKAIDEASHGKTAEALRTIHKAGRGAFRLWAEMYYAIPTFAMYKSLRDAGVTEADASFYVTDMMDLSARGKLAKSWVGALFPFVTSIGQTALQLTNYFGLNVTTFGHAKSKMNARQAARAWGYFGASIGISSMAIAAVATMLGDGDDEEGYRMLDEMSLDSFTFLPIPTDKGEYIKFPLGFGPLVFAFQTAMGLSRVNRGADTAGSVAMSLAGSFYRNISPLGGPEFEARTAEDYIKKITMTFTPLLAQPLVQLATDRNYFGSRIQSDRFLQPGERRADIDVRTTPRIWKELAQGMADNGIDVSPETVRHLVSGYLSGPLSGITAVLESDALTHDPMYASTREILGPALTAIGAGSMFSSVGNTVSKTYWHELNFYDNLIADAGVADLLKVKKGEKDANGERMTAYNKQRDTLIQLGFGEQVATDYAEIHKLKKDLEKTDREFKERINNAYKNHMSDIVINDLYRQFAIERNNKINARLSTTNYYQGLVKRGTVKIPPRELINAYRERNQ